MADRYTPTNPFQGVLVHDERFNTGTIDATRTTATQRGPRPDQPQPGAVKSFLQLEAFGEYGTAKDLSIYSTKEGPPVGSNSGGRFAWKEVTEPDTHWRGHSNHNKITGWRMVDGWPTAATLSNPHALRLPSGTVVCMVSRSSNLVAFRLTEASDQWSTPTTAVSHLGGQLECSLVLLPNNRILCFYYDNGLNFVYSDDEGLTWSPGGQNVYGGAISASVYTVRGIYHRGYITLMVGTGAGASAEILHLVSDDLGGSFSTVETITARAWPDLWVDSAGRVGMVYTTMINAAYRAQKGTAFSKFADDPSFDTLIGSSSSTVALKRPICATVDEEGFVWVYMRQPTPKQYRMEVIRYHRDTMTVDLDESYYYAGGINNPMDQGTDDNVYLTGYCVVPYKGSLLILGTHIASNSPSDDTLSELRLGGYSNLPTRVQGAWGYWSDTVAPAVQGMTWLAIEDAATVTPWVMTNTGASAINYTLEGMEIITTAATRWYQRIRSGTGYGSTSSYAHIRARADTFPSLGTSQNSVVLFGNNGTNSYGVELRITKDAFRILDDNGGKIGTDGVLLPNVLYDWFLILEKGYLEVWFKKASEEIWVKSHDSGGLPLNTRGAGITNNEIEWGTRAISSSTTVWVFVLSSFDGFNAYDEDLVGMVRPSEMQGRPYSTYPLTLTDGARLQAKGSSTYRADTWSVNARHDYGLDKLDPVLWPSPLQTWRSLDAGTEAIVTWAPNGGAATSLLCSTIGCYLDLGTSGVETVYLEASTDGTTWTTLATMKASDGLSASSGTMTYLISGDWVRPATGTATGQQFLQMDELAAVRLQDSGTFDEVLSVSQNAAGVWRGTAARKSDLRVAGDLAGHTGSPVEITLINKVVTAVVHNVTAAYAYYRLRAPIQGTVGGFFELANAVIGPVLAWGQVSGWGRRARLETNVRRYESDGGSRRTEQRSAPKRVVDWAWPDGWDMTELSGADPDPTYLSANAASSEPFGVRADATLVERTLARARSGAVPAVYLPSIAAASSGSVEALVMTAREMMVYGYLEADNVTRQALLGDEWSTEVVSVSSLTLREL